MPIAQLNDQNRRSLIDQLIAQADSAMYAAKIAGGNHHQDHNGRALARAAQQTTPRHVA
jgi:hypothetical protein